MCQAMVEVASKSRSDVSWTGCGSGVELGVGAAGGGVGVAAGWPTCVPFRGTPDLVGIGVGTDACGEVEAGTGCSQSWKWPLKLLGAR